MKRKVLAAILSGMLTVVLIAAPPEVIYGWEAVKRIGRLIIKR